MILEAVATLFKVLRFHRFFIRESSSAIAEPPGGWPKVTVFAPCKGLDPGMRENIQSWFDLDYPDYKIFFLVDSKEDPALAVLADFPQGELIFTGKATDSGQKVHNLRVAVGLVPAEFEVLAFVDSDGMVKTDWLRKLVHCLLQQSGQAATGYRWFTNTSNFGSMVRSAWNASILTLYSKDGSGNFAWGGATAIFRKAFDSFRVLDFWKGSISDDYSLTNAVRAKGGRVQFVPAGIAFTHDSISFPDFLQWIFRQLLITRTYYPRLWTAAFAFHCAWVLWIVSGVFHFAYFLPAFVLVQFIQAFKADLRWQCIQQTGETTSRQRILFWFLGPVVGLCNSAVLLATLFTRKLRWRNVDYVLLGPNRLEVRHR